LFIHTVRPGDTVYKIAQQYGVSAAAIISANVLTNPNSLIIGQPLIIPQTARSHTVVAGDTLYRIAQRYGISLDALLLANPQIVNPNNLQIGQVLQIPWVKWGDIVVNGYAYPSTRSEVLREALPHLTFLSVFSANLQPDGSLIPMDDQRVIALCREYSVQPHMVIANLREDAGFQTGIATAVLQNPAAQNTFLDQAIALMKARGYTGLDLDLEYVRASDRDAYNCLLAKARARLHDEGFVLSAALAAKTSANQPGLLFEGHDYAEHGRYDDYVILMTYDWGYVSGPPMAVAPLQEVRRVVDYAVREIPREKILLGIPNYAYDWTLPYAEGTKAKLVYHPEAILLAARQGAQIKFDEAAQTPYFHYFDAAGKQHVVWFEDARSILAKLELVRQYRLGGVSYWAVNHSFPQNWYVLDAVYQVKKEA
jgi:spore germination protein